MSVIARRSRLPVAVNNIGGDIVLLTRAVASFDADARKRADAEQHGGAAD